MSGIMPASKMGFGCMRLPLLDPNDQTSIDLPQFKQMVDVFMEAGNTYFDTAFVYHEGASETALGEALVARYPRDSFTVATKCLAWALPNKEAAYNCLDVSLERMGLDYVDYYLLHNVGGKRTAKFDEYDMWNFAQEQKAAGKIKYVGFSIHDDWECLDKLLTAHPEMDFVQLQVNYLDWEDPHNEAGYHHGTRTWWALVRSSRGGSTYSRGSESRIDASRMGLSFLLESSECDQRALWYVEYRAS